MIPLLGGAVEVIKMDTSVGLLNPVTWDTGPLSHQTWPENPRFK